MWQGKSGTYLIAEIGGNHEGDFEYAKKLTELACQSGADSVKYQIYTGDTLVSPIEDSQRNQHFKKFELQPEQYIELAQICRSHNMDFSASVWNPEAFNWINEYLTWFKIGSGDMTAFPVLEATAKLGKPMILSTGLSTLQEVTEAVQFIRDTNSIYTEPNQLVVLQCTSMYPIPDQDAHLSVMETFKKELNVTVGYSDHTIGNVAVETAVAMGARVIEFHFTDDREGKTFRDHKISYTKDEVLTLVEKIKRIRNLQGSKEKAPTPSEIESDHIRSFRRALYPNQDLKAGAVLSSENTTTLRPNHGIDARDFKKAYGKTLKQDVKAFEKISFDILD